MKTETIWKRTRWEHWNNFSIYKYRTCKIFCKTQYLVIFIYFWYYLL